VTWIERALTPPADGAEIVIPSRAASGGSGTRGCGGLAARGFRDVVVSLWITTSADRLGRRMLVAGAVLMVLAGWLFASTDNFLLLLVAATVGVLNPSGNEVGPFLSVEQASLAQFVPGDRRTGVFAWYNLVGSVATALVQFQADSCARGSRCSHP
jgi:hypothetical protein